MTPEEVLDTFLAPGRQNPEFQEVFDRWQEFNRSILEMARDAGNFSTSSCLSGVIPCTSTPIASSACAACSGVTLVTPHHFHGVFWNAPVCPSGTIKLRGWRWRRRREREYPAQPRKPRGSLAPCSRMSS